MAETAYAATPALDMYGSRRQEDQQALLVKVRRCFTQAEDYEGANRRAQVAWLKFRKGEQWEEAEQARRIAAGRPCLTINTLPQSEHQITNAFRLNMPALTVLPVGNGADVETAKLLKGLIRHCNERSHAELVRQMAFDSAVRVGAGYYRMVLEYDGWDSFDQEPRLAALRNQFACYLDPACTSPIGRGAEWGFVFEHHDKDRFQEEWGTDTSTLNAWQSVGDSWIAPHHVRMAEYFWKDRQRMTLAELVDGTIMVLEPYLLEELPLLQQAGLGTRAFQNFVNHLLTPAPRWQPLLEWMQAQAGTVVHWLDGLPGEFVQGYAAKVQDLLATLKRVRPTDHTSVRWIKTNGHVILEESVWPGEHIPLLRMVGEEMDLDNQVWRSGIIQNAMDPMRLENYAITMMAENVALSPLPGYLLDVRQIQGYEHLWRTANRIPHAYLPYNASVAGAGGTPLPPPSRSAFEPPIQGIALLLQMFQQYTQQAMGIYQGNVGAPSKERSGRAIAAKDEQTDTGTAHYGVHAADTMRYEGELYVQVIPKVMNPTKVQRILGDDGSPQMIRLAASPDEKQAIMQDPAQMEGLAGVYDLSSGSYDVLTDIGPSYATKRQEAADQMLQLTERLPAIMGPTASFWMRTMDWEGAQELSDLVAQLPGQILPEQNANKDQQLALLRQQLTQAGQQLQALNAFAQQLEGQMQQLAQQNATLKEAHDLEALKVQDMQRDSALAEREASQKYSIEQRKLDLEERKVELEAQRLEIERQYKQATARGGGDGV